MSNPLYSLNSYESLFQQPSEEDAALAEGWWNITDAVTEGGPDVEARLLLRAAKVTPEDLVEWHGNGWLSNDFSRKVKLAADDVHEIVFIRNMVWSGIGRVQMNALLSSLPKPYRYDWRRVAFNFGYGWVECPDPDYKPEPDEAEIDEMIEQHLVGWLATKNFDELRNLRDRVQGMMGHCGLNGDGT